MQSCLVPPRCTLKQDGQCVLKTWKVFKNKKSWEETRKEKKVKNAFFYYYFFKADNKAIKKMAWKAKGAPSIKVYIEEEQKKKKRIQKTNESK